MLTSENLINDQRLKNIKRNNYNIVLINNGDGNLINEFLNLKNVERIEEPNYNNEEFIDLKMYNGKRNNKIYTFFDLKGKYNIINNENKNIFMKLEDLLIRKDNPDNSINCIWYCFQGLNFIEADKKYIKELLNVYDIYKVPIIIVHSNKNFSEYKSNICKEEIEKYLNEIYSKDKSKVNNFLQNYINLFVPKNEKNSNSFGLDDLENISINKTEYNLFYKKMQHILINAIFDLSFPEYIVKKMAKCILENLDNKTNTLLSIINNDEFDLNLETKRNNQINLVQIFSKIQNIEISLNNDLKKELGIEKLKSNNQEILNKYYNQKSKEYKDKININKFIQNVNTLIYKELNSHSDEIINNIINFSVHLFIIQRIKESIKEQYQDFQKQIIKEIYNKLKITQIQVFVEQIKKNLAIQNKNVNSFQTNYKNKKKGIFTNRNNFIIKKKPINLFEKKEESKIQTEKKLQIKNESNNIHNNKNKIKKIQYIQTQNENDIDFKPINNKNNFNCINKIEKIEKIEIVRAKSVPKINKVIKPIKESEIQPIFQNNKRHNINPNCNIKEKIIFQKTNNFSAHKQKNKNIDNQHEKYNNIPYISRNPNYKSYIKFENIKEAQNTNKLRESKINQNFYGVNINNYISNENIIQNNLIEKFEESKEQNSFKKDNLNYINKINEVFKEDNINSLNFNKSFHYKQNTNLNLKENEIFNKTYNNPSLNIQYRKPIFLPPKVNRTLYQYIFNQDIK